MDMIGWVFACLILRVMHWNEQENGSMARMFNMSRDMFKI